MICNAAAVGYVAMGVKRDPAVRLCVTCGKLKSADQFAPRRRKCVACQRLQPTRARDQALRRLGLEHLDVYRELYRARRREIPDTVPRPGPASKRLAARSGRWSSSTVHAMSSCTRRSSRELGRNPIRGGPAGRRGAQTGSRLRRKRYRRGGGMGRATANPARTGSGRGDGLTRKRSGNALSPGFARAARPPPSPRNSASPGRPRHSGGLAGNRVAPQHYETDGLAGSPQCPTASCRPSSRPCSWARRPTA
jgi:hypothetical protein